MRTRERLTRPGFWLRLAILFVFVTVGLAFTVFGLVAEVLTMLCVVVWLTLWLRERYVE